MKGFWIVLIILGVTGWMSRQARLHHPERVDAGLAYRPVPLVIVVYGITTLLGTALVAGGMAGGLSRGEATAAPIGAGLIVLALASWPKPIITTEADIRQRSWSGTWKSIPWTDVSPPVTKKDGRVIIRGNGQTITLSQYHMGREQFLDEIRKRIRCGNFG